MAYPVFLAVLAGIAVGSMLYYLFAEPAFQRPLHQPAICSSARPYNRRNQSTRRRKSSRSGCRENIENCSICCENLFEGDSEPVELECSHYFHKLCIQKWLKEQKKCPNCKRLVRPDLKFD